MSYQLFSPLANSLQSVSRETWSRILNLARFYGWQPMGTLPPYIHNLRSLALQADANEAGARGSWDGSYLRNEGQTVRAQDALSLAAALETSLDDIPDVIIEWDTSIPDEDDMPEWLSPAEKAFIRHGLEDHRNDGMGDSPFEYFGGDRKQRLAEFIRFCTLGEFVIS